MADLTNSQTISQILQRHHLTAQKRFGQNFLTNHSVLDDSITAAKVSPTDVVVEIGAGIGTLTQQLAQVAAKVIVFEVDQSLRPVLKETLADYPNIELHFQDFRHVDLVEILQSSNIEKDSIAQLQNDTTHPVSRIPYPDYKVVANLPYNAGTHIIGQLIQLVHPPQSITVLLQKEVAQKITATPPHATYLSNFIQTYGQAKVVKVVDPDSFFPPPQVHSAILHLTKNDKPQTINSQAFSGLLHRGFASPRKKINKAFEVKDLQQANIDPNLRPENISFEQWLALFKVVKKGNGEE